MSSDNLSEAALGQNVAWLRLAESDVALLNSELWPPARDLLRYLPAAEVEAASTVAAGEERDHFLRRRVFQRLFVASLLDFDQPLSGLPLRHVRDSRPVCQSAPNLCLSFSTAGSMFAAAASLRHAIGIDIERLRTVNGPAGLADRYFSSGEAAAVRRLPPAEQSSAFIRLWSAKEACLKTLGTGVVAGLDVFRFEFAEQGLQLVAGPPGWHKQDWRLLQLSGPAHHVGYLAACSRG